MKSIMTPQSLNAGAPIRGLGSPAVLSFLAAWLALAISAPSAQAADEAPPAAAKAAPAAPTQDDYREAVERANGSIRRANEAIRSANEQVAKLNAEIKQLKFQLGQASSNHLASPWQPFMPGNSPSCPMPPYPKAALEQRLEGEVWLWVVVATNGLPFDVTVQKSSGHALLDRTAKDLVQKKWSFGRGSVRYFALPIVFRIQ
jgi:TonB family protein